MNDKIKKALAWIGAGIVAIAGIVWAILGGRPRGDKGADRIQREIRKSSDRTGSAVDRQGRAIDEALEVVGNDKDRKRDSVERKRTNKELIEHSRHLRERAKKLLDEGRD